MVSGQTTTIRIPTDQAEVIDRLRGDRRRADYLAGILRPILKRLEQDPIPRTFGDFEEEMIDLYGVDAGRAVRSLSPIVHLISAQSLVERKEFGEYFRAEVGRAIEGWKSQVRLKAISIPDDESQSTIGQIEIRQVIERLP